MGTLKDFFRENSKAALGFSGGVDSVYLLYAAVKYGAEVKAYFVKTPFQPEFELNDALKAARMIGAEINIIELDILAYDDISSNPDNRCYYCKKHIFGEIYSHAKADGIDLIIDGTNASDDAGDRPGMKAINELGVRSPLRECGLTKDDIRRLSNDAGLFTWNKPSYSCLATRIPSGTKISGGLLKKIEMSENVLFSMGFNNFRVRYFHDAARLQFTDHDISKALTNRSKIIERLTPYFNDILIDLKTR